MSGTRFHGCELREGIGTMFWRIDFADCWIAVISVTADHRWYVALGGRNNDCIWPNAATDWHDVHLMNAFDEVA